MFQNRPFLGQVSIQPGTGFNSGPPWAPTSGIPGAPPPAGFPSTSESVSAPGGAKECYDCGFYGIRKMTAAEKYSYENTTGRICTKIPASDPRCRSAMGQATPAPSGGADFSVTPEAQTVPAQRFEFPTFLPPPYAYPPVPPPPGKMICKKLVKESEDAGQDVFECTQEPPPPAPPMTVVTRYPLFFLQPMGF